MLCLLLAPLADALAQDAYQNLLLASAQPTAGETISFTYKPAGTHMAGKQVEAIAYLFSNNKLEALDVPLSPDKGSWKGKLPTSTQSQVFFLHFEEEGQLDNNSGKGYAFLLHDKQKKPVKGAWGNLASGQLEWAALMQLEKQASAAAAHLRKEFSLYPESKKEFFSLYAELLLEEKKEAASETVLQELELLLKDPELSLEQTTSLFYLLRRMKMEERASQLRDQIIQRDPKCQLAQDEKLYAIHLEKDIASKRKLMKAFISEFPDSDNTSWALNMVVSAMKEAQQWEELIRLMEEHPQAANWSSYNEMAWQMATTDQPLDVALALAKKGYALAAEALKKPIEKKDAWTSEKQWRKNQEWQLGQVADTYAFILMKQNKFADALPLIEQAVSLHREENIGFNERYAEVLVKTGQGSRAKAKLEQFISNGHSNKNMKQQLRERYIAEKGSETGFDNYLSQLEAPALEKLMLKIRKKMISEKAPDFMLENLQGQKVSLSALRGKTVIVDFWATWCGPCVQSFPSMQEAVNKYSADPGVAFVFINSWENGDDREQKVRDFMSKRNFSFNVLFDAEDKTIDAFKVQGIPTKFIIDKEGNIRYKSVGFEGSEEAAVQEISMLIDLLR